MPPLGAPPHQGQPHCMFLRFLDVVAACLVTPPACLPHAEPRKPMPWAGAVWATQPTSAVVRQSHNRSLLLS